MSVPRDEIVRAGAGAGKTYTLTHKVMDLAEDFHRSHGRMPRVVVTTFTRKATQELRERLILLALEERPHLSDFVNSRSQLVISTIHGVMDLYLKRFGSHLAIDPGYRIVSSPEAMKIAKQTLRRILFQGDTGAPSGLSNILEQIPFNRLASLVRKIDEARVMNAETRPFGVEEFHTLFLERAANVAGLLMGSASQIQTETDKESWTEMAKVYRELAKTLSGDWLKARAKFQFIFEELKPARRSPKGGPVSQETAEEAKRVRELAAEFLEPVYDPEVWKASAALFSKINDLSLAFSAEFSSAKREAGLMEISDLELLARTGLARFPDTAEAFSRDWDYWMIDEYQDTSPFQVELIKLLKGKSPSFIVGDPQQSIYLFRGARSEVFAEREREIKEAGGLIRELKVNRRSQPELLCFFNDFFARLKPSFNEMEPFLFEGRAIDPRKNIATFFIAEVPADNDADSEVSAGSEFDAEETTSGDLKKPSELSADAEMLALVRHVQDLIAGGARPEDICVLARTNQNLTEAAEWLNKFRLPTHVHVASGYFDRREVRDALGLLKFLVHPHDNFNTVELLRSPWFKMPDASLAEVARRRPASLWESLLDQMSMSDEFEAVGRLSRLLQLTEKAGVSGVFARALVEAGFIDLAHAHDVSGRRESNLWKLIARLSDEEGKPGFNPLAFVASCQSEMAKSGSLVEANAEGDAVAAVEPDRINLMTIHSSKGLEFKHVILPRMQSRPRLTTNEDFTYDENRARWCFRVPQGEDQSLKASLPEIAWLERFREQELREHARVLYVALTRASESVFMSWTTPAEKNSWAELVPFDLSEGEHACERYTYRVLNFANAPDVAATEVNDRLMARAPYKEIPKPQGALDVYPGSSGNQPMSVSDLIERKPGKTQHSVSGRDISVRLASAARGTAVHRLMELLKYPSKQRLERLVARWFPQKEAEVLDALNFVKESIEPNLMEIITNGEVEWRFSVLESGLLIEGQIDLWGTTDTGGVWIVDYKTGSPKESEKAFAQMAIYSLAIRRSGLLRSPQSLIQLAAVYPFARQILIKPAPDDAAVRGMLGLAEFDPRTLN